MLSMNDEVCCGRTTDEEVFDNVMQELDSCIIAFGEDRTAINRDGFQ